MSSEDLPIHYGVVLFPGFQALDVFGPIDAINTLARYKKIEFSIIAATLDPVSTNHAPLFPGQEAKWNPHGSNCGQSILPTHTFDSPPDNLEVLLVPGGAGTRSPQAYEPVVEFIKKTFPSLRYLLTICTGSGLVARSGLLDGRRATTNKRAWDDVITWREQVNWIRKARWVDDGNIWTSSGISAGIDMMLAFIGHIYDEELATTLADRLEYVRSGSWDDDPFA
ncbi:ThiJ/PfpI family protein [Talaromyces proteolyticus]|uniref:ThiJ/PfpI family protein n=1 Tax=Talaromyces proteolyticus TaxID=1131652 RepID=A0AAD4KDE9_9EURO|nr:ThiJ/PfpI family protein [Talaromyces proteolyticus]KAH8689050.1 ThiJ/PfpI family protein [Talaromyces proteolyticus]